MRRARRFCPGLIPKAEINAITRRTGLRVDCRSSLWTNRPCLEEAEATEFPPQEAGECDRCPILEIGAAAAFQHITKPTLCGGDTRVKIRRRTYGIIEPDGVFTENIARCDAHNLPCGTIEVQLGYLKRR